MTDFPFVDKHTAAAALGVSYSTLKVWRIGTVSPAGDTRATQASRGYSLAASRSAKGDLQPQPDSRLGCKSREPRGPSAGH